MISSVINQFKMHPRRIFLVDGLGALVTIFFLRIVLVQLNNLVGIPVSTLKILAPLPMCVLVLDAIGYTFYHRVGMVVLRLIILLNICYCFVSIYFGWIDAATITLLGWTYLVVEIIIIVGVVLYESRVLTEITEA